MKITGKYLKARRKKLSITQRVLSDSTGVSQSNISKIEGGSKIYFDHLVKILEILRVEMTLKEKL